MQMPEGYHDRDTKLFFYGLIYPRSFLLVLQPNSSCYYISKNQIQIQTGSANIKGQVYQYGFDQWNGKDLNTCTIRNTLSLTDQTYYTAWSFLFNRDSAVCEYIIRLYNQGATAQNIMFVTLGSTHRIYHSIIGLMVSLSLYFTLF
eukprot:403369780